MYSDELVKKLLLEVVQRRLEFTTLTMDDVAAAVVPERGYYDEYEFSILNTAENKCETITIVIEETTDTFEVHLVSTDYRIPIILTGPLGLAPIEWNAADFFDDDDSSYNDINLAIHRNSPWVISVEKSEDVFTPEDLHKVHVKAYVNQWIAEHWSESHEAGVDFIKLWFTKTVLLPAFFDSTLEDQAHTGMPKYDEIELYEVLDFLAEETDPIEGSEDLEDYLEKIYNEEV